MKKILGLDLGTASIGWALVDEAEHEGEKSSIIKAGVRVVPLNPNEENDFLNGKSITTTANRTLKRGMRRNLQRYKLRREALITTLKQYGIISGNTILCEDGPGTAFQTYRLRAKAADEEISLEEFARVLLMLNAKRGYKSNRKMHSEDEGESIDGIGIAQELFNKGLTPGQYAFEAIMANPTRTRSFPFYRSDLESEFEKIWDKQKQYHGVDVLSDQLRANLVDRNSRQTWTILKEPWHLSELKRSGKRQQQIVENYKWRVDALSVRIGLEELAVALSDINSQIKSAGGYLGAISDRSKEIFFSHQTIGQHLMSELDANPNESIKNQVFYRKDYIDEFNRIWDVQAQFHPELTPELKKKIRDEIIFYQRPLKSQKGLVSLCEFEHRDIVVEVDGVKKTRTVGLRVCPKSSPLFQEFKVRQILNNIVVSGSDIAAAARKNNSVVDLFADDDDFPSQSMEGSLSARQRELLYGELLFKDKMDKKAVLKLLLGKNYSSYDLNYNSIEGNRTTSAIFASFIKILEDKGRNDISDGMPFDRKLNAIEKAFSELGIGTELLHFDSLLQGKDLEYQAFYRLWHLLYSYEGDNSATGDEALVRKLEESFGFDEPAAKILSRVRLQDDYGSLSAKAIRKIMPYLKDGFMYSDACEKAGYRHSVRSLSKEEIDNRQLIERLDTLPKNSLRNPVVEKILNQMINVVNAIIDEYGRPDEVRIEMARELKKSATEREEATELIAKAGKEAERIRKILENEFHIASVSRNDIIRYRLWEELAGNGYKSLYSGTEIHKEEIFSKQFDIEHIIPQSKRFDDSFANKTLELRSVNQNKGNMTAYDYVKSVGGDYGIQQYENMIRNLLEKKKISKTKAINLLTEGDDIESGFLHRDLADTRFIARKAREILESVVKVVTPTTGSVTSRLREDWQLVDVMKELNWPKYEKVGKTHYELDNDGRRIPKIEDWTKRNDNRHHAMDAITIAFTKPSYIQYLNNLNARRDKMPFSSDDFHLADTDLSLLPLEQRCRVVSYIEAKEMHRNGNGKLVFNAPIPLNEFRAEVKNQLENVLVSIKAKNKVTTENTNIISHHGGNLKRRQLTPRGRLHNETIYGQIHRYNSKSERVGTRFDADKIATVASSIFRDALLARLNQYGGDPRKAFTGKNSLENNPIWLDGHHSKHVPLVVKTVTLEPLYTMRVPISPNLSIDKVVDRRIRRILEARVEDCKNRLIEESGGDVSRIADVDTDAVKQAFSNLEENPIWLDKEHGISIKRVTITGKANVYALRSKRDKSGRVMLDESGNEIGSDFVSPANNHHVAIYMDANGDLQESVIPFIEAVRRSVAHEPIVDKHYKEFEGWKFLFSMKKNELFVFPDEKTGFDPNEIDLTDSVNYALISPHLFRVQKLTTGVYVFRHHLETNENYDKSLRDVTWKRIHTTNYLKGVVKVRVDHLGQIVHVGE